MKNFKLLMTGLNTGALLEEIEGKPELWHDIIARQATPGSPHTYTETIFLKWSDDQSIHSAFNELESIEYPAFDLLPQAKVLINSVIMAASADKLGRVIIVKLAPGCEIELHADEGKYADTYERFHICLQSEYGNRFFTEYPNGNGEFVHMKPGQMWYFNHKAKHFLHNHSDSPRINLIVDCIAPAFRRERE